jgi:hypothetical protein
MIKEKKKDRKKKERSIRSDPIKNRNMVCRPPPFAFISTAPFVFRRKKNKRRETDEKPSSRRKKKRNGRGG